MVVLPPRPLQDAVVRQLYELAERRESDWRRTHLGASIIGRSCRRYLWSAFRWISQPKFVTPEQADRGDHNGRMLRLFSRGHREEDLIIADLVALGYEVESREIDGRQFRVVFAGGHFGGSCDGKIRGVPAAPKTWHLLEVKTANAKNFADLKKHGVRKSKPDHWSQMQTYMHGLDLERALYVCVCKDTDEIYTERVRYDKPAAEALVRTAEMVIYSPVPLARVSEDPTYWECKTCAYYGPCQMQHVEGLQRNCRTCLSSTPRPDGTWHCAFHHRLLSGDEQRAGCEQHLFVPPLLPWEAIDANEPERRVVYRRPDGLTVVDHHRTLSVGAPA